MTPITLLLPMSPDRAGMPHAAVDHARPIKQAMPGTALTIQGEIIMVPQTRSRGSDVSRNQLCIRCPAMCGSFFSTYCKVVVMLTMPVIGAYLIFTVGRNLSAAEMHESMEAFIMLM